MQKNVAGLERLASVLIGGISLSQTLKSERSALTKVAAAGVGMGLLYRGVTGHCPVYQGLDIKTFKGPEEKSGTFLLERSALVNLPIEEVRSFLEMEDTPYGLFDSGDSDDEFQIDIEDRTWILTLSPHADGNRTLIKATWIEHPTLSPKTEDVGQGLLSKINPLNQKPTKILELRKLKALMETGEIATIEGQPHGERSRFGHFIENFGDFVLNTIQSKTALPSDEVISSPLDQGLPEAKRKAHA